jgi:hypothetical protein
MEGGLELAGTEEQEENHQHISRTTEEGHRTYLSRDAQGTSEARDSRTALAPEDAQPEAALEQGEGHGDDDAGVPKW